MKATCVQAVWQPKVHRIWETGEFDYHLLWDWQNADLWTLKGSKCLWLSNQWYIWLVGEFTTHLRTYSSGFGLNRM